MAKIRRERNIIVGLATASTGSIVDHNAIINIDKSKYSGTVTAYFEAVLYTGGSSTANAKLRDAAGNDVTGSSVTNNTTTPTRVRSGDIWANITTLTDYHVRLWNTSAGGANVKSARLIIIQDITTISATQGGFEIGNEETGKTNTTDAALNNPKYWNYDASKYDGIVSFEAVVTYLRSSSMDTTTIKLQEDNGSFASWTDKATIVSAGTATTATRASVAFTPTDGRNYRLVSVSSSNMTNYSIYNAKIMVNQVGSTAGTVDSYSETNQDDVRRLSGDNFTGVGQSFTGNGNILESVKFYLKKVGSPTGNAVAKVFSHSGTFGTSSLPNTLLATSDNFDVSTLTTSYALATITFSGANRITLANGTRYVVCIEYTGGGFPTNTLDVGYDTSSPTHAGNGCQKSSGSYAAVSSIDAIFYVQSLDSAITKLEDQYLIANTGSIGGSTGLKDFDAYYDPAEWDDGAGSTTFYHEANGVSAGTGDLKLQSDPNGTPADVTNSTITDAIERERSSALTMPGAAATLDVNVTGTGTINASRLIVAYVLAAGTTTNNARSAEVSGKATTNASRSAQITGKLAANAARSAETSGRVAANAARSAETAGIATAQAERDAELTGSLAAQNSRAAEVSGIATTQANRDAETHGITSTTNTRSAELSGTHSSAASRAAETTGIATTTNTRSAETSGLLSDTASRDAELSGAGIAIVARDAEVSGIATTTNDRAAETTGTTVQTSHRHSTVHGIADGNAVRAAEIDGTAGASDSRGAVIDGFSSSYGDARAAETTGDAATTDDRSAELDGVYSWQIQRSTDGGPWIDIEAEIQIDEVSGEYTYLDPGPLVTGHTYCYRVRNVPDDSNYSNVSCVTYREATAASDSRDAELSGTASATAERDAEVHGQASPSNARDAETTGTASSNDYRSAEIMPEGADYAARAASLTGTDTAQAERGAETSGAYAANDSRGAELEGIASASATRSAEIEGFYDSQDSRSAETSGGLGGNASRGAELEGGVLIPYCPEDSPYSPKQKPYTIKATPYGDKMRIYTSAPSPYSQAARKDCH